MNDNYATDQSSDVDTTTVANSTETLRPSTPHESGSANEVTQEASDAPQEVTKEGSDSNDDKLDSPQHSTNGEGTADLLSAPPSESGESSASGQSGPFVIVRAPEDINETEKKDTDQTEKEEDDRQGLSILFT